MAASTDAPFGHADPWRAIAHAASRTTPSGVVLGAGERVPARRALDLFLTEPGYPAGPPRRVEVGARAELCLLDRPLADALVRPSSGHVRATVSHAPGTPAPGARLDPGVFMSRHPSPGTDVVT